MKTSLFRLTGTVRTAFVLVASFGLLAAGVPTPARAANLVLQGATTAACTYSAASMDASGNLTVTTASSCGIVPPADTLALSSTAATVVVGGTFNVGITRANPSAGATSGTVTVTSGSCTPASSLVNFAAGVNSATVPFIAPGTAGTCTLDLTAGAGANLGSPSTFTATATAASPDVVAFGTTLAALQTSGSGTITVTRAGANSTGGVTATVSATGGCTVSGAGAVSFPNNSTAPVSLTVTAPASAATCTVTLAAGTGATLGTPNSFNIGVTAPPPPTAGACTTVANNTSDIRSVRRLFVSLPGSDSTAVLFRAPGDARAQGAIASVEATNANIPPYTELNIAECPGDFVTNLGDGCRDFVLQAKATLSWIVMYPGTNPGWSCQLKPDKTYYLNIRARFGSGSYGVNLDN